MADYYTTAVVEPFIPAKFIDEKDEAIIDAFFGSEKAPDDCLFFHNDEYSGCGYIESENGEDEELSEDEMIAAFQRVIVRSNGELPYVAIQAGCGCSKTRPDGFGGWAVFITEESVEWCSTFNWISQKVSEVKGELREAA